MTDAARYAAVRCLLDVESGAYSNLALKKRGSCLDSRAAAFAAVLLYGVLERKLTLDYVLNHFIKNGVKSLDAEVLAVLRLGLYQLLYLDGVPARAAVNESVELCKTLKKTSAKGLVNAVLRKAGEFSLSKIDEIQDETEKLSVKYSLCPGLVALLKEQYAADAEKMMAGMFERTDTAVRVNVLKTDEDKLIEDLKREGVEACKVLDVPGALIIKSGDYIRSGALENGLMRVQSLSAQRAALALGAKPGMSVLDMCAAPGGKTLTVAQTMNNEGSVTALDVNKSRVELVKQAAERDGVSIVTALCGDAATFKPEQPREFDCVLCDVPCSGYGEIYTKPELRYKDPEESQALVDIQAKILDNGAALLKVGGRLVYSTCTIDKRENERQADAFLENHPGFRCVEHSAREKYTKFLPGFTGPEGFFIATFERMW